MIFIAAVNQSVVSIPVNNTQSVGSAPAISEPEATSVIGVSGVAAVNSTTTFVDDADVSKRDESHVVHVNRTVLRLNDTQSQVQELMDFLKKPIILNAGTFSITDTFSFLNSYSMPYAAFNSIKGSLWTKKLAGYFGMRMDMRFRIVVNANKMQQGRYIIGWVPLASPAATTSNLKNVLVSNMHLGTLVQRTTVPHVELDLNTGTSAELLVPFVSTQNFYPLNAILATTDISSLGYMNVYPYSPLVSPTGPTVCGYTLYVSFENITLYGAASAQSGLSSREVANKNNGPISGVASSFAKGFKEFASIPLLSTYATPISWVADRIAKTASMFGFSKPTAGDCIPKYQVLNCPSHSTIDGDSDARPLSYLNKPGVVELDGISGTSYDEMDFSYIVRKPAWFKTVTWSDTTVVGPLSTINVFPTVGTQSLGGAFHFQPVGFVNTFFSLWRGSLKFKFKVVKTGFHSGRIQFCFYPTDENAYTDGPEYVNRMIIDIRETTEVELIIPYISRMPWTHTGSKIGVISIDVVDILVAPANVSNSVTILCEIAGGDDMEFAIPANNSWQPTSFAPQSGLGEDVNNIITATIGNSEVLSNPNIFTSTCIGDKVSSFRAYLRRFHPVNPSSKAAGAIIGLDGAEFYIWPDAMFAQTVGLPVDYWNADPYTTIGSCYALSRGGIRIRDAVNVGMLSNELTSSGNTLAVLDCRLSTGSFTLVANSNAPSTIQNPNSHCVIQALKNNNTITVEIPQYSQALCRAKADIITFQGSTASYGYNNTTYSSNSKVILTITLPASNSTGFTARPGYSLHNIYRAMSDDGGFSCFISVPPMISNGVTGGKRGFY